jgi:LysM repeat protein
MNRPRRRQGSALGKIFVRFSLLVLGAASVIALWQLGYVNRWKETLQESWASYAPAWLTDQINQTLNFELAPVETTSEETASGEATPPPNTPLPVESALSLPMAAAPSPTEAFVATENRGETINGFTPSLPAPPAPRVVVTPPRNNPPPAPAPARSVEAAAPPVLSEIKAQLKNIDLLLRENPALALEKLQELTKNPVMTPDDSADVGYRLGYAARILKNEDLAEKSWKETAGKYPQAKGGRYSALALADTYFRKFAGNTNTQVSHWDDIQKLYSQVLGTDDAPFLASDVRSVVKKNLGRLNDAIFFGSAPSELARYHRVENGELLGSIAGQYRVDYESLARINGINPNRIRAGMDLKVIVGDVSVVVRKNSRDPDLGPTLTWFLDGRWVREYQSCVGEGIKTPAGSYQVTSKERDPSWTNPTNGQLLPNDHPENILGTRWMALKGMDIQGLGIHGTTVPDSIPGYTSAGCVRLQNSQVEELFSFIRIGARVIIEE